MKTARFEKVVARSGRPVTHLVLLDPDDDKELQSAVKAGRVMTVHQEVKGTKADWGSIGFEPGSQRQFLIFPKSIRAYAGKTIVGIKYDLFRAEALPAHERAESPRALSKPKAKKKLEAPKPRREAAEHRSSTKSAKARKPEKKKARAIEPADIRHAIALLEEGKVVQAFEHLKRLAGD